MTTSGTLFSTEHGPAGGDELNLIVEGANYGWPIVTLGIGYRSYGWQDTKFVGLNCTLPDIGAAKIDNPSIASHH